MITLKNIYKEYGTGTGVVKALNGIDLKIKKGDLVAIVGKSGSGKSTLLNILGGIDNVNKGFYFFYDKEVPLGDQKKLADFRKNNIGFILQYFALIGDLTVFDNVALPLKYNNTTKKEINKKVKDILKSLNIIEKINAYPNEMSGGQKQRVAIARALINNPPVILADEPTGALDQENEKNIMDIFIELNKKGKTIIIVTHDMNIANACNRIITLSDGKII